MGLLFDEEPGVAYGGANILIAHVVFAVQVFEGHATGQTAQDPGYGQTRAAKHGLSVLDLRIDDDAIFQVHAGLTVGVIAKVFQGT